MVLQRDRYQSLRATGVFVFNNDRYKMDKYTPT